MSAMELSIWKYIEEPTKSVIRLDLGLAFDSLGEEVGRLVIEMTSYNVTEKEKMKMKEICPRGNKKVVIYISLYHDKCLLFMLELY